jgi:surfeit locus 1 family protein
VTESGPRPLFWPTVFTAAGVLLLLALGSWQIQRLHWKEGLIAAREKAVSAAPVPAPREAAAARRLEYHPVFALGVFEHAKEIHIHAISRRGEAGFDVLTPLAGPDGQIIIVNRGFVPTALADPARRAAGQIAGPVRVAGLLRLAPATKPGWFLPDNEPARNEWFWVDLKAIAAADKLANVAPYYIDADRPPNPGGWPEGGTTRLSLPNHHLQYAITWFALAVALAVIYLLYRRGNLGQR